MPRCSRIVFPLAALLLLSTAGCGGATRRSSSSASCAAAVVWHGKTYFGTKVPAVVQLGQPLGGGTIPGCNDGGGPTPDEAVKLAAIEGVATDEAIAISGDRSTVYVEPSYFTQMPRTPLHDVLFGPTETKPNERGECEPGQTTKASVRAVVRGASFGMLTVTLLDTT